MQFQAAENGEQSRHLCSFKGMAEGDWIPVAQKNQRIFYPRRVFRVLIVSRCLHVEGSLR